MHSGIDSWMVIVYLVVMFTIGLVMYQRSKNYDDYLIAGRKFNVFFIAMTLAAGISSATLGVAGLGYSFGLAGAWFFIMLGLGAWLLLFTVAGRLRVLAQYSLTDVFDIRYGAAPRIVIGLLGSLAYTILLSIGFVGGGTVLQSVFNIPLFPAMLIMAVPFISYTALGGLWASGVTNIIKLVILGVGLIILIPAAIHHAGGWGSLRSALPAGSFNMFSSDALLLVWAFFWVMTLSMWVAPDIYQLLFSARNVRTAKIGLGVAGAIIIFMGLAAAFIGLGASVSFPGIDPEAAMPALAATLAPGLRGLVDIAMLGGSAIAVVIFQIVAATLLVRGIWPKTNLSMNRMRLLSALMGVIGLLFAGLLPNVISLTELTFRIIIPATFLPTLAAFYWKRATATGALTASLLGAAAAAIWTFAVLPNLSETLQSVFEPAFIGVAVSCLGLVAGSYLSSHSPSERSLEGENAATNAG
jgi:SSS family solute:Na+ symporter